MTRLYFPHDIPAHGVIEAPREAGHHLVHVLRVRSGDPVTVFDGCGHEYQAVIDRVDRSGVTLRTGEPCLVDRESPLAITLAQGISSGERMDYTVQKAVELGVNAIQPLTTERSVVRLNEARALKRVAHWQGIVASACEQCGRNTVPPVLPVAQLNSWLAMPAEGIRLSLSPFAPRTLRDLDRPSAPVTLLVGPEGGLAPGEASAAERAGYIPVRLGPRVLRTETAALAAVAALQAMWGDF